MAGGHFLTASGTSTTSADRARGSTRAGDQLCLLWALGRHQQFLFRGEHAEPSPGNLSVRFETCRGSRLGKDEAEARNHGEVNLGMLKCVLVALSGVFV